MISTCIEMKGYFSYLKMGGLESAISGIRDEYKSFWRRLTKWDREIITAIVLGSAYSVCLLSCTHVRYFIPYQDYITIITVIEFVHKSVNFAFSKTLSGFGT